MHGSPTVVGGSENELHKGLKQRHLTMIAIGGVIGAGLFVGSGVVIQDVGPSAFLTYAVTGVVIILVMRMLGEMATAHPSTGSFADYARLAMGGWAGFSVAWLYWYFWVIVVGFEAVAGAKILQKWVDLPLWSMSLGLLILMTATNLFSVSSYGEFEYWFAGIKVAAIVIFLLIGSLYVFGLWPGSSLDFSNLYAHGGFFPNGVGAVFSAIVVVIFSMVGAEVATIAAAESDDPERAIAKATNSVVVRICVFFIGSIFLLAVILPWNSTDLVASPYVAAFQKIGISGAADIMNAVVLTAVLSCLNSGLYTASRMLFVLAARREAPVRLITVNSRGVPMWAILFSTLIGYASVVAAYISPDTVFLFLLNSSGAVILFVYLLIGVSELILRRRTPPEQLVVKMWFYPWLTVFAIAGMLAVLISMGVRHDTRSQLFLSLLAWGIVLAFYWINRTVRQEEPAAAGPAAPQTAQKVLVVANETIGADVLMDELRRIDDRGQAEYFVCVPANPVDTGQAERKGAVWVWKATVEAAQQRLDDMLATMREHGLQAEGALGDFLPMRAMEKVVGEFHPDVIVISTHPEEKSTWLRHDIIRQAGERFGVPVRHVVSEVAVTA